MERKLTTIVTMDVVGYSRLMERDETGTLDRLKSARADILDPAIARHNGRTVKLMGDGTLAEFSSVVGALQCAVEIQEELAARNSSLGENQRVQLRIGVHLGDREQAESAVEALAWPKPEFSLDFAREHLFYLKREDQMDTYISGLEKAGVT